MTNSKKGHRLNALKHGASTKELLIFDEEMTEFKNLHDGFVEEFKPSGRMEEELVLELARWHLRKRRIDIYHAEEENLILVEVTDEEKSNWAKTVAMTMPHESCSEVWEGYVPKLPHPIQEAVKRKFHLPSDEHDDKWLAELREFVVQQYMHSSFGDRQGRRKMRLRGKVSIKLSELSDKQTAREERIDAAIDRTLRRLVQLKTYKEVMAAKEREAQRQLPSNQG